MFNTTYYMELGDKVNCMRCGREMILEYDPVKCCPSPEASARNMCGCQGMPEPIFCGTCWDELEGRD